MFQYEIKVIWLSVEIGQLCYDVLDNDASSILSVYHTECADYWLWKLYGNLLLK